MAEVLLEMRNTTKILPGVEALDNIDLKVEKGKIHVLAEGNGAGKSILMNVFSGIYPYGTHEDGIVYNGQVCKFDKVDDSEGKGIVTIYQELVLIPYMSIGEDMYLGNREGERMTINWDQTYDEANRYLKTVDLNESSYTLIKDAGVGEQQLVGVARALAERVRLLILGEPTASLNGGDSKALLELLFKLKQEGMTSTIISHKLNEIAYVAGKITVIRDGSVTKTLNKQMDDISEDRIIKGMMGRELTDRFLRRENISTSNTAPEVRDWVVYHPLYSDRKVVDHMSIHVNKGEVVRICGLMEVGHMELTMSIFGRSYGTNTLGQLFIERKEIHLNTMHDAISHKITYVTEDRKGNGLTLSNPIHVNTTLANTGAVSSHKVIDKDREYMVAAKYKNRLEIKCPGVEQNIGSLSSGNQQKVLLAEWVFAEPDVLILNESVRGVGVGAKYEIYCIISRLVEEGKLVIMILSELPEMLGMSDRIYIMSEGRLAGEVNTSEATQEYIMPYIPKADKGEQTMDQKPKISKVLKRHTMIIALTVIVILFTTDTGGKILLPQNVNNLVTQNACVFILAISMPFCILTGGNVDLPVGPVAYFVGAIEGKMMTEIGISPYLTPIAVAITGVLVGAQQGFQIAYIRIPPFIITLADTLVLRGLSNVVLQGVMLAPIPGQFLVPFDTYVPDFFAAEDFNLTCLLVGVTACVVYAFIVLNGRRQKLAKGYYVGPLTEVVIKMAVIYIVLFSFMFRLTQYKGIPNALIWVAVIIGIYGYIASRTTAGRYLYAVDGSEKATKLPGINTSRVYSLAYLNMGPLVAIAGITTVARLNPVNPTAGNSYKIDAISACSVGGASAYDGTGTVPGVIVGATLMSVPNPSISVMGVDQNLWKVVKGSVLLAVVIFDVVGKRKSFIIK